MSWRRFKNLLKYEKFNESQFILGIDIGDATSAICYFDANRKSTEIIDMSGGYGKATKPTVVQYLNESKEWVFGEYAILNQGIYGETMFTNLIQKLENKEYIKINDKSSSVVYVLSLYIMELIHSCKNINPNAEIIGIVVSVPNYIAKETKAELSEAFENAGFKNNIIDFTPQSECILAYHYYNKKIIKENILILDYGSRDVRGGLYNIDNMYNGALIKTLSYMFDKNIGINKIESKLMELFIKYYKENKNIFNNNISKQDLDYLNSFMYQHKDLIFQKNTLCKPIKLYFNFTYPPFQHSMNYEEVNNMIEPFKLGLINFIEKLIDSNMYKSKYPLSLSDIDTILCTGGGFEMFWARSVIEDMFPDSNIKFYKNPKAIVAEGASIIAAGKLGVIDEKIFNIKDIPQEKYDIGIFVLRNKNQEFISIMQSNNFWYKQKNTCMVIVNEKISKTVSIDIVKRDFGGKFTVIGSLNLDGLPQRPMGTTKLKLSLEYSSYNELTINVIDCGFGELFKASNFSANYILSI